LSFRQLYLVATQRERQTVYPVYLFTCSIFHRLENKKSGGYFAREVGQVDGLTE